VQFYLYKAYDGLTRCYVLTKYSIVGEERTNENR
jgi:hypothetical protein